MTQNGEVKTMTQSEIYISQQNIQHQIHLHASYQTKL